jgi:hypothetical protein
MNSTRPGVLPRIRRVTYVQRRILDAAQGGTQITAMLNRFVVHTGVALVFLLVLGCREKDATSDQVSRASLPPVFSLGPENNTNWDPTAGPMMLIALGDAGDSAAAVLPGATDSALDSISLPHVSQDVFDLYGRSGKIASSVVGAPRKSARNGSCDTWPSVRITPPHGGWQIALAKGSAKAIPLDSIDALSSGDSASLAASLAESVAALPIASDPTFRRLPFRVRYAYTAQIDSAEIVVADVVRALNEEANPRIEHIFVVGKRPRKTTGKFTVGYYSRTAGAEETTSATEVLAALEIGSLRRPAFVINVESDSRARFGLIESAASGEWQPVWWSAYTNC